MKFSFKILTYILFNIYRLDFFCLLWNKDDLKILSSLCKRVYFVPYYKYEGSELSENVTLLEGKVNEIIGGSYVSGAIVNDKEIKCDGVFLRKRVQPPSSIVFGLGTIGNVITVDENMETNIKGIFAAGDCTGGPFQIAKAVGQGLIAAQKVLKSL